MMRTRALLALSILLNLLLAAWLARAHFQHAPPPARRISLVPMPPAIIHTNVIVRRENFSWSELESTDYPTYIANLRAIGCPEATIRDIIVADVNALFDRRRATEIVTPDQQWWRSDPDAALAQAANAKSQALENERRQLLARLLGPDWDSSSKTVAESAGLALDGPVLGRLSPEVKSEIYRIHARALRRKEAYLRAQREAGRGPDPGQLALMDRQTRDELAQYLTSNQLEEYLLRYSQTARGLRQQLAGIQVTPEEFRSLFRIRDPIDQQLQLLSSSDPDIQRQRQALQQQLDLALRQTLGPDRFSLYQYAQDPAFVQARAAVQNIGASPETVLPLYQLNQTFETERARLQNDSSLTPEQQAAALQALSSQQQANLRRILGDDAYQRYLRGQNVAAASAPTGPVPSK